MIDTNKRISNVTYNGESIGVGVDLSNDTVTPESLLEGYTAHDALGNAIMGTAISGDYVSIIDGETETNINGLIKGDGATVSRAQEGIDYQTPLIAGVDYSIPSVSDLIVLNKTAWQDRGDKIYQQVVSVNGLTNTNNVIIFPDPLSAFEWRLSQINAVAQNEGLLTFECLKIPNDDINVKILIVG